MFTIFFVCGIIWNGDIHVEHTNLCLETAFCFHVNANKDDAYVCLWDDLPLYPSQAYKTIMDEINDLRQTTLLMEQGCTLFSPTHDVNHSIETRDKRSIIRVIAVV